GNRKCMTQDIQLSVQCASFHSPETFGAVRAHHARSDITESHAGQGVTKERIEGECLAVGSALARHYFVAIAADDVGHRDASERLVNLWSALVRLKVLLTCPHECFRL